MINTALTANNVVIYKGAAVQASGADRDNNDIPLLKNEIDQLNARIGDDRGNTEISRKDLEKIIKKDTAEPKNKGIGNALRTIGTAAAGFVSGAAISEIQSNIEAAEKDELKKNEVQKEKIKNPELTSPGIRLTENLTTKSPMVKLAVRGTLNTGSLVLGSYVNQNFSAEGMHNVGTPGVTGPGAIGLLGTAAGGVHVLKSIEPILEGVAYSMLVSDNQKPLLTGKFFGGIGDLATGVGLISQTLGAGPVSFPIIVAGIGINTIATAAQIMKGEY